MDEILVANRCLSTLAQLFLRGNEQAAVNGAWDLEVRVDQILPGYASLEGLEAASVQIGRILTRRDRVGKRPGKQTTAYEQHVPIQADDVFCSAKIFVGLETEPLV